MYEIKCEICNEIFKSEFKGRDKGSLVKHIKHKHDDTTIKNYIIKYYYNDIKPLCGCGCGKPTEYYKFKFHKYYMNHKNYVPLTDEIKNKISIGLQLQSNIDNRLKIVGTSKNILKKAYKKYKTCKYSMSEIARNINMDRRTLKKFWKELDFVDNKELKNLLEKTKYVGLSDHIKEKHNNLDKYLKEILLFVDINRNVKHTINQVKNELNIPFSSNYLLIKLREKYGEEVLKYFKMGGKSNLEIDFFSVLRFYFDKRVHMSFKLENRYYDYILDGKLLIELDGTYWHSSNEAKENDKYKNKLAIENGFQILRIDEKSVKNIETINNIIKISKKL